MKESKGMMKAEMAAMQKGGASKRILAAEKAEHAAMNNGGKVKGYADGGQIQGITGDTSPNRSNAKLRAIGRGGEIPANHCMPVVAKTTGYAK
jgi:hypothetical protein